METLVRPGKRAKVGASFVFSGELRATVTGIVEGGNRTVKFEYDTEKYDSIYAVLDAIGNMPLPPYITKRLENKDDIIYNRSNFQLVSEWRSHNLLYDLNYETVKTKDVNFNPDVLWHENCLYVISSFFYGIVHKIVKFAKNA